MMQNIWKRAQEVMSERVSSYSKSFLHMQAAIKIIAEAVAQEPMPEDVVAQASRSADLEKVLRDAFPHFQDSAPVTTEAIKKIGCEYLDMVNGWEPLSLEIKFIDGTGKQGKLKRDEDGAWRLDGVVSSDLSGVVSDEEKSEREKLATAIETSFNYSLGRNKMAELAALMMDEKHHNRILSALRSMQ